MSRTGKNDPPDTFLSCRIQQLLRCAHVHIEEPIDSVHVPVGGEDGTLRQLEGLRTPRKMYIHINNTNPMLNEAGAEYRAMREAGWELAEDGCQFTL